MPLRASEHAVLGGASGGQVSRLLPISAMAPLSLNVLRDANGTVGAASAVGCGATNATSVDTIRHKAANRGMRRRIRQAPLLSVPLQQYAPASRESVLSVVGHSSHLERLAHRRARGGALLP